MFRVIKNYFNKRNLKNKDFLFLFEENTNDEYVCSDCETTGQILKRLYCFNRCSYYKKQYNNC